ncbi:hypothetical protein KUCAC02_018615, partial [Chaenocephalus aceratus]
TTGLSPVCQDLAAVVAALQVSLWHVAPAGMALLSSVNEDHAAAVWTSDGQRARFVSLSAMGASRWEMSVCPGTAEQERLVSEWHRTRARFSICSQTVDSKFKLTLWG